MSPSRIRRWIAWAAVPAMAWTAAWAAPVPSSADGVDRRAGDARSFRDFVVLEKVADAMTDLGYDARQIDDRLSRLSEDDLRHLADNPNQIRTAGTRVPEQVDRSTARRLDVPVLPVIF